MPIKKIPYSFLRHFTLYFFRYICDIKTPNNSKRDETIHIIIYPITSILLKYTSKEIIRRDGIS